MTTFMAFLGRLLIQLFFLHAEIKSQKIHSVLKVPERFFEGEDGATFGRASRLNGMELVDIRAGLLHRRT